MADLPYKKEMDAPPNLYRTEFIQYCLRPHHAVCSGIYERCGGLFLKQVLDGLQVFAPEDYAECVQILNSSYRHDLLDSDESCNEHMTMLQERLIAAGDEPEPYDRWAAATATTSGMQVWWNILDSTVDKDLIECLGEEEHTAVEPADWQRNAICHAFYLTDVFLTPSLSWAANRIYEDCKQEDSWSVEALDALLQLLVISLPEVWKLWGPQ